MATKPLKTARDMFYFVEDVMRILGYSKSKSYKVIKSLNRELEDQGKCTCDGRVIKRYFHERYGLDELNAVTKYLAAFGVPETHFAVDLTIARGLDYYTGTVYETTMLDHPEIGSICSGGRYDNLAEYYTNKQLPRVGISIGLPRLFFVLEDQGYLNDALNTAPADALILPMTEDLAPAISLATLLRENGIRAQLHCEEKKFKQKIAYADKLGIPYVIFLGEDEISSGVVACKDMATGEQTKLEPAATVYRIKAGLAEREKGTVIQE